MSQEDRARRDVRVEAPRTRSLAFQRAMQLLTHDATTESARIHWLLQLRWVAVAGVFSVVLTTGPLLHLVTPWPWLLAIVFGLGLWNLHLSVRHRRGRPVATAGFQVIVDLLVLWTLLFLSGGVRNPFCVFLVVQVILTAMLLPRETALGRGLLGAALLVVLAVLDALQLAPPPPPALIGAESFLGSRQVLLWGVTPALLITVAVALHFTTTIMDDLRARADEARQYLARAEGERRNLRDVVRSLGAGLVVTHPDLRIDWFNQQAGPLLPFLRKDDRIVIDGGSWPRWEDLEAGRVSSHEWRGPDAQGHPRQYEIIAAAIAGDGGRPAQIALLFADVTERRAAANQLQRTEKLAALGRLAAGLAHEIATPLGSVNILAGEALTTLEQGPPDTEAQREIRSYLADLKGEVARIAGLVRQLLDLGHPDGASASSIHLDEIARDVVRLATIRLPSARARVQMVVPEVLPPVIAEPGRVRQVLLNVVDNALDATEANAGPITLEWSTNPLAVILDVRDRGHGITEADLDRVFDPFFTTKEVGRGTGLGLYVTYEIMKNLGGDIAIASQPGQGTTVRLTFPFGAS